jgi:GAF domain-containing protein
MSQDTRKFRSIRGRLIAQSLGSMIFAILVVTAVAINSANNLSLRAQRMSNESLRSQTEASLRQINQSAAIQNNLILDRAARDVQTVANAATAIYSGDLPTGYWPPMEHIYRGPEGQYLNGGEDTSSVFVPNTGKLDQGTLQDIELSAYLDLVMAPVFENNPNAAAIYFGTPRDVVRYYPNIKLGEIVPADFQVTKRVWYTESLSGNLGNPEPQPIWSTVYVDATGLGLVTTVAVPVYDDQDQLVGVVGLDLTLEEISNNISMARFLQSGYSFLIDQTGKTIILPEQGYQDIFGRPSQPDEFGTDLRDSATEFAVLTGEMVAGESGFKRMQLGGREVFVAFSPMASTGWSLVSVVLSEDVLQSVAALEQDLRQNTQSLLFTQVIPIIGILSIALIILVWLWANYLVTPLQNLAGAAEKIGAGQWETPIPVERNDETGLLAETLMKMVEQLRQSFAELELRVVERTQALEHRSFQLRTAAEVARDITTGQSGENLRDPNLRQKLLENAVNLISERFGHYNVNVFLIDEINQYAYLKASSGNLGRKLIEQGVRIRVGQQGIVGYVTGFGQPRIASDVHQEAIYVEEPLLGNTRSEVALPLKIGDKVIGALDVQSTQEAAFGQEDIAVLQILADQLAIAIENTRLVERLQATLDEINILYQKQVRQAWEITTAELEHSAYEYDRMETKPVEASIESWSEQSSPEVEKLILPIKLRDETIGFIGLESDVAGHQWTEDEIAIVEAITNQAAITLENARLLAESQQRAAREHITSQVTSQMRASLDMQTVIQTAIREIADWMGIDQVEIHLGEPDGDNGRTLSKEEKTMQEPTSQQKREESLDR